MSLADLQHLAEIDSGNLEVDLPNLERCSITVNSDNYKGWSKILENGNKAGFKFYIDDSEEKNFHVRIDNVEQLQIVSKYMLFDDSYYRRYKGWFEYSFSDEEMQSENIVWAENKSQKGKTKFGIKIDGDKMYRIAVNRGTAFVYLDSASSNTLENFLKQEKDEMVQEYKTDSEYDDECKDYDD